MKRLTLYNQTVLLTLKRNIHLCALRDMYGGVDASVSVAAKTWKQMSITGKYI